MYVSSLPWLAAAFVVLAPIFTVLERRFPERPRASYFSGARVVDWEWWPFTALVTGGLTRVATLGVFGIGAFALGWRGSLASLMTHPSWGIGPLPLWLQFLIAIVVGDLVNYWNHRLRHTRWLWPFHAVHHSPVVLDWLSSVRMHPVDDLIDNVPVGLVVLAMGTSPAVWLATGPFLLFFDLWLHADLPWRLGPLRYVIATPAFHRWHHADSAPSCNFAGVVPLYDLVFGTFYLPLASPCSFGPAIEGGLLRQLISPFARYVQGMRAIPLLVLALLVPATARAAVYDIHPGDDLFGRLGMLVAGDEVVVHAGTYTASGSGFVQVTWAGTAAMPIVVHAAPGDRPILMGNPSQNVMNVAGSYFTISGFEITGGSHGLRLGPMNVDHATIADNYLHDLGDVGISCNFDGIDCGFVTIQHNEITRTGNDGGTGEGMYLGCNAAACIFHDSTVEQNWVHATGGSQGDGIEIKTGAYSNEIRDNVITNTGYPGLTLYGFAPAAGHMSSVCERNLVWHTMDNGIQIVGQMIVRNNVVIDAAAGGIASKSSQGFDPHDLTIVNNTVVGDGDCLHTNDWETQTGQAVIDNAFYCAAGNSIRFATGLGAGADVRGNIGVGGAAGVTGGLTMGVSVAADLTDPTTANVYPPSGSALINAGSVAGAATDDFDATPRTDGMPDVGAYERTAMGMPAWIPADAFKGSGSTTTMDGGVPMTDAGPGVDAGPAVDAGPGVDGGPHDGGTTGGDGGTHGDAGTGMSSGGCCHVAGVTGGRADVTCGMLALLSLFVVVRCSRRKKRE